MGNSNRPLEHKAIVVCHPTWTNSRFVQIFPLPDLPNVCKTVGNQRKRITLVVIRVLQCTLSPVHLPLYLNYRKRGNKSYAILNNKTRFALLIIFACLSVCLTTYICLFYSTRHVYLLHPVPWLITVSRCLNWDLQRVSLWVIWSRGQCNCLITPSCTWHLLIVRLLVCYRNGF